MTAAPDPAVPALADLRTTPAAIAVARDVVRVAGPDAVAYLQGQLSQDIAGLVVGGSARSFVLQPAGKVDAWLRATRVADDEIVLDVDAGHGEAVVARLRRFLLRTKADVDPLDWRAVALRGPGVEAAGTAAGADAELAVPAGWPGVEGVDLLGPDVRPPASMPEATPAALESLRIRCGVPALGTELTDATIPAEAGQWVIDASVSFTKGCFTGQELVARIDSRGGNVPRRVRGLTVPGDRAPTPGAAVLAAGDEVGRVTSVAPSPDGGSVALALVARAVTPPAPAEVAVAGGEAVAATVVDTPIER
jgi:tRNA-modifying protein YgfZ